MKIKILLTLTTLALSLPLQAEEPGSAMNGAVKTDTGIVQKSAQNLKVEIQLGTGIENYDPVGVADSFPESVGKVVGWTRVTGAAEPTEIVHVWSYKGEEKSSITLNVKSSKFRTYSRKTVEGMPGGWKFTVKDGAGTVLAETDFEVTARSEGQPAAQ